MSAPRVSVLLPVRDCEQFVSSALASIRRQSFSDLEILCIDDGSRDGSARILDRHAAADPRVRVLRQGPRGIVAALNNALAEARGALIARMDADDVSHRNRIEWQVAALDTEPDLTVVGSRVRAFPDRRVRRGMRDYLEWSNAVQSPDAIAREILVECPVVHPSVLARKRALIDVGGYRHGSFPEDYDLWLRLHRRGHRFRKLDCFLLAWRERPERLTRTHPMYERGRFLDLKAEHIRHLVAEDRRRVAIVGAGVVGKPLARRLARLGVPVDAFVDLNPRKIGLTIHGAPVIHPDEMEPLRGAWLLAAVSARGQRDVVRNDLEARGFREGEDFLCVV